MIKAILKRNYNTYIENYYTAFKSLKEAIEYLKKDGDDLFEWKDITCMIVEGSKDYRYYEIGTNKGIDDEGDPIFLTYHYIAVRKGD